jgi:hypothetical protein
LAQIERICIAVGLWSMALPSVLVTGKPLFGVHKSHGVILPQNAKPCVELGDWVDASAGLVVLDGFLTTWYN